jgi:bacteriocin resistance YdeI/OmpD-like protein/uncharacterized protein DUF1905
MAIRFKATLSEPTDGRGGWTFLVLPRAASAKLPSRGQTAVEGTLNGIGFAAMLDPDGRRSHWLKVTRALRTAAGAAPGDEVDVDLAPAKNPPEPKVPADLRKALTAAPKARAVWADITPAARHDWILWITSAKRVATRATRISSACDMLGGGKRRVCCFDRSGVFGKNLSAPQAKVRA